MLVLIENGSLYDPEPRGVQSLLIANERIEKVGAVDRRALDALDVEYVHIDLCAISWRIIRSSVTGYIRHMCSAVRS
jgi:hypothetical protein